MIRFIILIVLLMVCTHPAEVFPWPLSDADSALKMGDYDAAIRLYRELLKEKPSSYEAKYGLARAFAFAGRREEATKTYTEILSEHPGDPDALLGRGRIYGWEGRFKEAESDLTSVTNRFPSYDDAWSALGDLYYWWGRSETAVSNYTKLVELNPSDPKAYIARAKAYMQGRQFSLARKDLIQARLKGGDKEEINRLFRQLDRVPKAKPWEASLLYSFQKFSSSQADWNTYTLSIGREFTRGSLVLEALRARRFSTWDEAIVVDGYLDLWIRAYGNARLQVASDADILPLMDIFLELFQGFGEGWEVSGSYRHMGFSKDNVDLYGVSFGRYMGNWFLREQNSFVPGDGELGHAHSILARRYFKKVDDYFEVRAGLSKEWGSFNTGDGDESFWNYSIAFKWQYFFISPLGISISGNYSNGERNPAHWGGEFKIIARW